MILPVENIPVHKKMQTVMENTMKNVNNIVVICCKDMSTLWISNFEHTLRENPGILKTNFIHFIIVCEVLIKN